MKDNEIIKALEDAKKYKFVPDEFFIDKTLDLINRQQAEIEALIAGQETLQKYRDEEINRLEIELKAMRGAANSYKAEVGRLNKQLEELKFLESRVNSIKNTPKDTFSGILISMAEGVARYEAIEEFAERLKEKAWHGIWETINHVDVDEIDNLVEEMVGEG